MMTILQKIKLLSLTAFLLSGLVACGGGSTGGGGSGAPADGGSGGSATTEADTDTVTTGIKFSGGTVVDGTPPAATNNAGDITLTNPSTDATSISTTGASGSLDVKVANVPANKGFNVNVRFGSSKKYISIPVAASVMQGASSGTLNIPFTTPPSFCDNITQIKHQIKCYESVDMGNGQIVSKETARDMILACENDAEFATGTGDLCADNYPKENCSYILANNPNVIASRFVANTKCATAFPKALNDSANGGKADWGCAVGDAAYSGSAITACGACAIDVNTTTSSTNSISAASMLEDAMYEQLMEYKTNPEARKRITFTPDN